jgi:hypothetical protein
VGLPSHTTKKVFFSGYRKPVFRIVLIRWAAFCPLGGYFTVFLAARYHDKSPGLFSVALMPPDEHRPNWQSLLTLCLQKYESIVVPSTFLLGLQVWN